MAPFLPLSLGEFGVASICIGFLLLQGEMVNSNYLFSIPSTVGRVHELDRNIAEAESFGTIVSKIQNLLTAQQFFRFNR